MPQMSGHCLCGDVTWISTGEVLWSGHCHCDSCRRATAAPFTSFFGVPRDTLTWQGPMTQRASSNGQVTRGFCTTCGSQMWYKNTAWPHETHLYAATLVDPCQFQPQAHYHYAERLDWLAVNDDLPKYPGTADDGATP